MKTIFIITLVLGEILAITNTEAHVILTITDDDKITHVKKMLSLEDFPCVPYPDMLFYYTERGNLICGEPEPN
jgi:hypothetical protein